MKQEELSLCNFINSMNIDEMMTFLDISALAVKVFTLLVQLSCVSRH